MKQAWTKSDRRWLCFAFMIFLLWGLTWALTQPVSPDGPVFDGVAHAQAPGAGIANVSGVTCVASATSCTLGATPAYGTILIGCAFRNSATAATTATNYTVIKSTTGNSNSMKCGWKMAVNNETTCGTWTNATQIMCLNYQGGYFTDSSLGGWIATSTPSGTTGSSTTISLPSFTLQNPYSTSWVMCGYGGVSATNVDAAPSGMTLRSGTTVDNVGFSDTNGNVSSFSAHTLTVSPTGSWASVCFEMVGFPASSSTIGNSSPTAYMIFGGYYGESEQACVPATGTTCIWVAQIPPTLANNALHIWFTLENTGGTNPTVTSIYCNSDTTHATWPAPTLEKSVATGTPNWDESFDYLIPTSANAPAGCNQITIVTGTALWTNAVLVVHELYNVGAVDFANGQESGAPYMTPDASAPSPNVSGDIILDECTTSTMNTTATDIFSSNGDELLHPDPYIGALAAGFVETGSTGIIPYYYMLGVSGNSVCNELALKPSPGTGTAPSGVYPILSANQHVASGSTNTLQQHVAGNGGYAFVLSSQDGEAANQTQWSGITDSLSDSLTYYQPEDSNGGYPNYAVDCAAAGGDNILTVSGVPSGTANYWFTTWAGLNNSSHSACYCSTAGASAFAASGATQTNMPSITPCTSSGVVLASSELGTGTPCPSGTSPSGAIFTFATYTGQGDNSGMGLGNMGGYYLNNSTSAVNWGWNNNGINDSSPYSCGGGAGSTSWNASGIFLQAPASGTTIIPALPLLGSGVGD